MRRVVEPELLDSLRAADPRAVGSRADLRRLNFIMGHERILTRAFRLHHDEPNAGSRPFRLVELGAGDGTFLLRLARRWSPLGVTAEVTLIDRQALVSAQTRRAFAALNWSVESVVTDVFGWLEQWSPTAELMLANLFLHHLADKPLGVLLRLAAARTNLFIACEPRRSQPALIASLLLPFMGCNAVTRHDAPASVRAGFAGRELSALWPADIEWESSEQPVGLFSHCFIARRHA